VHKTKLLGHVCLYKPAVRTKTYINLLAPEFYI